MMAVDVKLVISRTYQFDDIVQMINTSYFPTRKQ